MNRGLSGEVIRTALPAVADMLLISLMGFADTMMVGRALGAEALSAVGLTTQPRMLLLSLLFALNVGVTAETARKKGEGDGDGAEKTLKTSLLLALGLSAALLAAALAFGKDLILLSGGDRAEEEGLLEEAAGYFRILACTLPPHALLMVICAYHRGMGRTRTAMLVNLTGNIVNVFLNFCLIGGRLGFPRLEVRGAALATAAGIGAGLLGAVLSVTIGKKQRIQIRGAWLLTREELKALMKTGGNAALEQAGLRAGFFLYTRLLFSLGTAAFAASQICMQTQNLSFTFGDGLGVAGTALVGRSRGENRMDKGKRYGKICLGYAVAVGVLLGVILILFRYPIAGWFMNEKSGRVKNAAAEILLVLAAAQPFQIGAVTLGGCLRGAGDTLFVALIAGGCVSVLRPVFTYLAVRVWGLGAAGAWAFGMVEFIVRFACFCPRLLRKKE